NPPMVQAEALPASRTTACRAAGGRLGSGRRRAAAGAQLVQKPRRAVGPVIVFRQADSRVPPLWETSDQPAGRWHGDGEGPAHYFADTPDGAWAEFLRHEEITDPADLEGVRRRLWAVEIGDDRAE